MLQLRFLGQFDVRADGKRLLISTRPPSRFLVFSCSQPGRLTAARKSRGCSGPT